MAYSNSISCDDEVLLDGGAVVKVNSTVQVQLRHRGGQVKSRSAGSHWGWFDSQPPQLIVQIHAMKEIPRCLVFGYKVSDRCKTLLSEITLDWIYDGLRAVVRTLVHANLARYTCVLGHCGLRPFKVDTVVGQDARRIGRRHDGCPDFIFELRSLVNLFSSLEPDCLDTYRGRLSNLNLVTALQQGNCSCQTSDASTDNANPEGFVVRLGR